MVKEKLDQLVSVYHYTTSRCYKTMQEGNRQFHYPDLKTGKWSASSSARGLWPRSTFIPKGIKGMKRLPKKAYTPVTYALFSPEPKEWTHCQEFPKAWWALMEYFGDNGGKKVSLLEIDLCSTDEAYVVDASYIVPFIFGCPDDKETLELYKKRFESMVSLVDYLNNEKVAKKFILPEVIIQNPIPNNRFIRVGEQSNQYTWNRGIESYQEVHQKAQ